MSSSKAKPWYKQFWPWFLIVIPLTSMVLSFTMIHFAYNTEDSLVIDEYYKEGRGINMQLTKIQEAKAKGITTSLSVVDGSIELRFKSGLPESAEALALDFQHATLEKKDFSVLLVRDANGIYRATTDNDVNGKWKLSLHPIDQQWRIQQTLSLPRQEAFSFNP